VATRRSAAPPPQEPVGPFGPPVTAARSRELRALVLAHGRAEPRRRFPALLHVGRPGGPEAVRPAHDPAQLPADDHALRVELLEAMLRRVGAAGSTVWLTRPGPLTLQDVDAGWGAALRTACAELAVDPVPMVVVTRTGWWEPATGSGRRWRRLRAYS
jgi:hypothetical protein